MNTQEWINNLRTFPDFPNISLGWPAAEHGVEWDDEKAYAAYLEECAFSDEEAAPFEVWMNGDRQADLEELEGADDLGFRHSSCDLCGSFLEGDRYAATALPENPAENPDYIPLEVCGDCLYFIANGDVPDWLDNE
ncbi:MAG: hypothetical protein EOM21_15980 [Gammaproteobacteria bacterium]|nr:hypothetical protein [Gammaproteobacteria bacterium]